MTPEGAEPLDVRAPEIDDSKVGLSLISVVYGIVLGEAFLATVDYNTVRGVIWSKLAVATTAIVLSYIGFYNNRDEYPVWKARFINIPFLQYVLSIATLATYWGMVAAAQGVDVNSVRPEAVLVAAAFIIYFLWDWLQVCVQRDPTYCEVTRDQVQFDALNATGPGRTTYNVDNLTRRTIVRRRVTVGFTIALLVMGGIVWCLQPKGTGLIVVDVIYCALLLLYRLVQEWAVRSVGSAKVVLAPTSGAITTATTADELEKFASLKKAGVITDEELSDQKNRLLST